MTVAAPSEPRLKLTEIFYSLQGESRYVGWPTVFVRLTGCPLRCQYCDTTYSFTGGLWHPLSEVLATVASYGAKHVCVTGGEPLAQKNCLPLLQALCDAGYTVSLETSGALDVSMVDARVCKVMDIKTPDSGESSKNLWSNLAHLDASDEIKFVLCSRADYDWARAELAARRDDIRCPVLFSPSHHQLAATDLADWMLADRVPARLQLQLHKLLWGEAQGR